MHVWVAGGVPAGIESWDPDSDPTFVADGRGHALFELYARCRLAGRRVTIGPRVPDDSDVVVLFSKDLSALASLRAALSIAHRRTVVILNDWNPRLRLPFRGSVVVGHHDGAPGAPTVVVPLLPQRGMRQRASERVGRVRTVGFRGDPRQAPAFWTDPAFEAALGRRGVTVERLEDPTTTWHDFSELDVVLCLRRPGLETVHKPPTKLINAWVAGCIPLVGPEPAYLGLAVDGVDALVVRDRESVEAAVQRLVAEPDLVERIEAGVARRAEEFARHRVEARWFEVLDAAADLPERRRPGAAASALRHWAAAQVTNHRPGGGASRLGPRSG